MSTPSDLPLDLPSLPLHLENLDDRAYEVSVRTLEDAGSMQTRRMRQPVRTLLPRGGSDDLRLAFATGIPDRFTHAGMVVAVVTACPVGGGPCVSGTSEPLFFHPDRGMLTVYDEEVLCRRYGCGDLDARGPRPESGTWRVMGGAPLHDVPTTEEPGDEDDRVVDGGES